MARLLYSAKDRHGKPLSGFTEAPSVREAREQLANGGMTDIVLHQDPALGGTDARVIDRLNPAQQRDLARLSIAAMRRPGLPQVLHDVAWMNRWWLLLDVGVLVAGLAAGSPWLASAGAVLAAWPFAVALWTYRDGGRYQALLRAFAVGDAPRIRELVRKLRPRSGKVENMAFDLDVREAWIAARDGRLQEALALVEHWREPLLANPGFFEQRIAPLYYASGDREGCIRLVEQACAASGGEPSRALDVALMQARFGDAGRAQEVLDGIDVSLLPSLGTGFVAWTRGILLLRQKHPRALEQLSQALAAFLALEGNPAVWPTLGVCTCDHALALLEAGRKDQARQQVARVWHIVQAHADRPLLRALEADGLAPN